MLRHCLSITNALPGCMFILSLISLKLLDACSPAGYKKPTTTERILQAPVVLYGRIQRTYPDPQFQHIPGSVYTAQMEVYCTLKGPKVHHIFNISQAGEIPGHCSATTLVAGREYFVMLNNHMLPHGLDFSEIDINEKNVQDVTKACDLMPLYPHGISMSTSKVKCPEVAPDDDCISETMISANSYRFHESSNESYQSLQNAYFFGGGACQHHGTSLHPIASIVTTVLIISFSYIISSGS